MPTEDEIDAAAKCLKGSLFARLPDWTDDDFKETATSVLSAAEPLRNPPATGRELDERDD